MPLATTLLQVYNLPEVLGVVSTSSGLKRLLIWAPTELLVDPNTPISSFTADTIRYAAIYTR